MGVRGLRRPAAVRARRPEARSFWAPTWEGRRPVRALLSALLVLGALIFLGALCAICGAPLASRDRDR